MGLFIAIIVIRMHLDEKKEVSKFSSKKQFTVLIISWATIMIVFAIVYVERNYKKSFTIIQDKESTVAFVNNSAISMKMLNMAMSGIIQSGQLNGVDTTKPEVQDKIRKEALDTVIDSELLVQKAKELKLVISQNDISSEMNKIEEQFGNREEFLNKIKSVGISEQDLRDDIEKQLLITSYQNKIYDSSKDIVKDSDIKIFYEALRKKYIEQDKTVPELDQIREKIISKILDMRHQKYLDGVAEGLRKNAKIEILI